MILSFILCTEVPLDGEPTPLSSNVACVDYSVAKDNDGKLVAHRWDGEKKPHANKFSYVLAAVRVSMEANVDHEKYSSCPI